MIRKLTVILAITFMASAYLLGTFAAPVAAAPPPGPPPGGGGGGDVVTVLCPGDSLQAALDEAKERDTINVFGTCSEPNDRFIIRTDLLTIDGQGTVIDVDAGVVTGGAILDGRITVRGIKVSIRNLTLRGVEDATSSGIAVNFNASATIQGSVIKDAGNNGISINQGGYAQIGSDRRNHIEVGDPGSQGNLIQDNTDSGISIRLGGVADVAHNVIRRHLDRRGVGVSNGAVADIAANIISFNDRGISVSTGGVVATDDSGHEVLDDSDPPELVRETNTISNSTRGINCSSGGILSAGVLPNYVSNTQNLRASDSCVVDSDLGPIS